MKYEVKFDSVVKLDENQRKYLETTDNTTKQIHKRYLDHIETAFLANLEQSQLIVLAQEIYNECLKRGIKLSFFED